MKMNNMKTGNFNFGAFFFTWVWCCFKGLWQYAFIFLFINIISSMVFHFFSFDPVGYIIASNLVFLYTSLWLGINGNTYVEYNESKYLKSSMAV